MIGYFLCFVAITSYSSYLVVAQIPRVCSSQKVLQSKTCCPIPNGASSACGEDMGRGSCTQVSTYCNTGYDAEQGPGLDPRLNWPTYFFNRVCRCNGNYGGYDCSECQFGYEGSNCNTKSELRERKSMADMSDAEWLQYNNYIRRAKSANDSRYVILVFNETTHSNAVNAEVVNISVYDMFVWMHHYAGKNARDHNSSSSAGDYAHEATGFLTWHRLYLLWLEREIQLLVDDSSFTTRYWNWTNPDDRQSIFVENKMGMNNDLGFVVSDFYGDVSDWKCLCWFDPAHPYTCDPRDTSGVLKLVRCPATNECREMDFQGWPSTETVEAALAKGNYSQPPYNKHVVGGFRNALEGYDTDPVDPDEVDVQIGGENITRRLHNLVHIILGLGSYDSIPSLPRIGVMADIASPNDPVFVFHHTMVDLILEQWLLRWPDSPYGGPVNDKKFAGHSEEDCIVPFIPLYTHGDMFKVAEDFGYSYPGVNANTRGGGATSVSASKWSMFVLMLLVGAAAILFN